MTDGAPPASNAGEQSAPTSFRLSQELAAVALGAPSAPAQLPQHLAAPLSLLELQLARHLAAGATWQQACDRAKVKPSARLRSWEPKPHVLAAASWIMQNAISQCGMTREWVTANCVILYRRACQVDPVLDRQGRPTGVYRFDGATAARMLELLGQDMGMFGKGKVASLGVDHVAVLLEAVASRGRRQLEPPSARLVGSGSAAIEQAPANKGEDTSAST